MMKITGLSHLFKWENLHNLWLTKYFFAPLYIHIYIHTCVLPFYIFSSDNVNFTITFPLSTSFVNIYIYFFFFMR